MKILNFGSLNLDYVYQVPRFVRPGETLAAEARSVKFGGKGLNQSVALARAGAQVSHSGCTGAGGESLKACLMENGVNTDGLTPVAEMQGHTIIQVNPDGENCILLYGGSNRCVTETQVRKTLDAFSAGDYLLLQNEINLLPMIVEQAYRRGMQIALNPSPYNDALRAVDFGKLTWLLVNEIEAEQITGQAEPEKVWEALHEKYPRLSLLITLGRSGSVVYRVTDQGVETVRQEAIPVRAVDTTGAGDTFTGYFIAGLMEGMSLKDCMARASLAAAVSVTRPGAADSIPWKDELIQKTEQAFGDPYSISPASAGSTDMRPSSNTKAGTPTSPISLQ